MSELRQRSPVPAAAAADLSTGSTESDAFMRHPGTGLSAASLIDSAPQQHGVVLKLHIPVLYTILPEFLQRFILSWSVLSFLAPSWKQRHLILCGSYLYKFKDRSSSIPKGAPFEIDSLNVDLVRMGDNIREIGILSLPPGYTSIFKVSTLRRVHHYAVADVEEAMMWVRSINEARQECITRNMGHASNFPCPKSWTYFDSLGSSLVKSKDRIRLRMEESRLREMEMTDFSDGGPIPRTYLG